MGSGTTSGKASKPEEYSGYTVTLNTLARLFPDTREDVLKHCQKVSKKAKEPDKKEEFKHHTQTYLTYGDFDRVSFKGKDRFSRFFDLDGRSKYWLGKHQNIFLYKIEDGTKTRLYPYQKDSSPGADPTDSDFGFCIQDANKDNWFLYSALEQTETSQQNPEANLQELQKYCFPFFMITLISFSNDVITRVIDYKKFIEAVKKGLTNRIDYIISREGINLKYEIFGSLNTSELCIIWLTEQYAHVLNVIEDLKTIPFKTKGEKDSKTVNNRLFFVFYSIVGRMLANKKVATHDLQNKLDENENSYARIEIITGNDDSAESLWNRLKEQASQVKPDVFENSTGSARIGEHDLSFSIPVSRVYDLFCEVSDGQGTDGAERKGNPGYIGLFKAKEIKNRIIGIKATLLTDIKNEKPGGHDSPEETETGAGADSAEDEDTRVFITFDSKCVLQNDDDKLVTQFADLSKELNPDFDENDDCIKAQYTRIRTVMKKKFNSHSGSVDTLDTLYRDYLSNIHESYNALWRNDYNYQFKRSLSYLEGLLKENVTEKNLKVEDEKHFWEQFTNTIENIRQQTVHFSQSGRLGVQVPSSHLRYTAGADKMLHSYYGSVKAVLEDAYHKQKDIENLRQSELLPIITTNSTPYITSSLYKAGNECDDLRILQVDIPYSLLFDPIVGFSYLVHEMFHYITPQNRNERNDALCKMIINEVICVRYLRQIEKGLKRHFYELICSYPDKYRELCTEFLNNEQTKGAQEDKASEGVPDSEESAEFTRFFEKCTRYSSAGNNADVMRELHRSMSEFLWNNDVVTSIRSQLLEEIKNDSTYKHADNATWNDAINSMWTHLREMPVKVTSRISEEIRRSVDQIEQLIKDKNYDKLREVRSKKGYPRCRGHFETSIVLDSLAHGLENRSFPEIFEKILFDHKNSLLNPYHLEVISENSPAALNVNDRFINGLREATPDMAMVSYCEMDNIDYLVTYARQIHDTNQDIIADFDIVRLSSVLLWMDDERDEGPGNGKTFRFQDKGEVFIERYLAEYLPQNWEQDKEKLKNILKDAICWFIRLVAASYAFRRDYEIYSDDIKRLGKCYEIYYETKTSERILASLTNIVKNRRKQKPIIRFGGNDSNNWEKLISRTDEILNSYLKKEGIHITPKIPDKNEENIIKNHIGDILKDIDFDENSYSENKRAYNEENFKCILDFIYTSEIQTTFEKISNTVNNKRKEAKVFEGKGVSSVGSEVVGETTGRKDDDNLTKNHSPSKSAIYKNVEDRTRYRIWGMSDLSGRLTFVRKKLTQAAEDDSSPIWYCTKNEDAILRPKVFSKNNTTQEYKAIYEFVEESLQFYLHEHEGDLRDYYEHESVARMTLESPSRDTNLLFWHGTLYESLPESNKDNTLDFTSLYVFSPLKYLRIRSMVLDYYNSTKRGEYNLPDLKNTPIIFQHGERLDEYDRFILGNSTGKIVNDDTASRKGEADQDDPDTIADFLPIPLSFVGLKQNCRFLAYDLASPLISDPSHEYYSLVDIQKKLIFKLNFIHQIKNEEDKLNEKECSPKIEINTLIDEYAFLYRLDIGKEVLKQLKDLTSR